MAERGHGGDLTLIRMISRMTRLYVGAGIMLCISAFFIASLTPVRSIADEGPLTSGLDLENHAKAVRQAIESGTVEMVSTLKEGSKGNQTVWNLECRVSFQGNKLRFDSKQSKTNERIDDPLEHAPTRKNVIAGGKYYSHTDKLSPQGRRMALTIKDLRKSEGPLDVFDPRLIGMLPCDTAILHAMNVGDFLTQKDKVDSTVKTEMISGQRVLRVDSSYRNGRKARMWFAPQQGGSLIRGESEFVHPKDGKVVDSIECDMKQWDADGVWFPKKVVYQRRLNGDVVTEEQLTVKSAEFNIPVDESVFTLAGMDIPPGTDVVETPSFHVSRIWNGSKLAPNTTQSPPLAEAEALSSTRILLFSFSLALIAALLFAIYWRRRAA